MINERLNDLQMCEVFWIISKIYLVALLLKLTVSLTVTKEHSHILWPNTHLGHISHQHLFDNRQYISNTLLLQGSDDAPAPRNFVNLHVFLCIKNSLTCTRWHRRKMHWRFLIRHQQTTNLDQVRTHNYTLKRSHVTYSATKVIFPDMSSSSRVSKQSWGGQ